MKNARRVIVLLLIVGVILMLSGITMAAFQYAESGSNPSSLTTGQLKLELDESLSTGINLTNTLPISDEDGKALEPYTFTLKNTGTMSSVFTLSLTPDLDRITAEGAESNLLDYSDVKVQFNDEEPVLLSSLTDLQLETGNIDDGRSIDYSIRLWIDYDATNEVMGKELYLKVKVEATQGVRVNRDLPYERELDGAKTDTGNSYVDTGIIPTNNTKMEIEFTRISPITDTVWIVNSRVAYQDKMFGIAYNGALATPESLFQFGTQTYTGKDSTGILEDVRYKVVLSMDGTYIDDVFKFDYSNDAWTSTYSIAMFANNQAAGVTGYTKGRVVIHSLKLYESNTLVLDAIPVVTIAGDVAYWDKVSDEQLTTTGTLLEG